MISNTISHRIGRVGALALFAAALAFPMAAFAEVHALVFKQSESQKAEFHTFASEEEYTAKGLAADSHVKLTEEEVKKLQAGETLIVSERMPMVSDTVTAWGVAFADTDAKALYDLHSDYANWKSYFDDILEIQSWPDSNGEHRVVYQLKKASVNVAMTLYYTNVPNVQKEWNLIDKKFETLPGYTDEQIAEIKGFTKKNDFAINTGGWYFVESDSAAMGGKKTAIVRCVAVKLGGIKNAIKGPEKVKAENEEKMDSNIKSLVGLAEKNAKQ